MGTDEELKIVGCEELKKIGIHTTCVGFAFRARASTRRVTPFDWLIRFWEYFLIGPCFTVIDLIGLFVVSELHGPITKQLKLTDTRFSPFCMGIFELCDWPMFYGH